jgi:hypothetical protein
MLPSSRLITRRMTTIALKSSLDACGTRMAYCS